jgi:hypothetical protein
MAQNDDHIGQEDENPSRTLDSGKPLHEIGSHMGGYTPLWVLRGRCDNGIEGRTIAFHSLRARSGHAGALNRDQVSSPTEGATL